MTTRIKGTAAVGRKTSVVWLKAMLLEDHYAVFTCNLQDRTGSSTFPWNLNHLQNRMQQSGQTCSQKILMYRPTMGRTRRRGGGGQMSSTTSNDRIHKLVPNLGFCMEKNKKEKKNYWVRLYFCGDLMRWPSPMICSLAPVIHSYIS